jgi:poly(glycerol-phosphate) alpha-glucosyltransferase
MAVLEAMAYRLPVLMTDACNFPEAAQADVAWAVPPRVDAIAIKLGELLSMSTDDARQRGTRARAFIEQGYSWNSIALQMIAVYRWMLGGGTAPDAVRND